MDSRKASFLFLSGLVLLAAFASTVSHFWMSPDAQDEGVAYESRQLMGTIMTIEIVTAGENSKGSLDAAFGEIDRIEDLMSTYKPESELSRLNREGQLENPSLDLVFLMNQSVYYGDVSNGAFDVTIMPILSLWKTKINQGDFPTGLEINDTLLLVNYSNITVRDDIISFEETGMSVTLDGIAKGYAVDKAVEVLRGQGYENGFVNAGGDGMYFGTKSDGSTWRVGLRNPDNKSDAIAILDISNMAVATSGNYERYFSESARLSHISNPKTGYSSQDLISATIIASSAMEADTLATAVFVLGPVEGMKLIEQTESAEGLLITPERSVLKSSGFEFYEVIIS